MSIVGSQGSVLSNVSVSATLSAIGLTLDQLSTTKWVSTPTLTTTTITTTSITGSTAAFTTLTATSGSISTLTFTNAAGTALTSTSLYGTLQTPAQANITSVGSLLNLSVAGTLTTANLVASAGTITTLTSTSITGTLQTAAQANITSVGSLLNLSVAGTLTTANLIASSGTITTLTSTAITGTLQTAAQPNVTSLGALVNASVTGSLTTANLVATTATIASLSSCNVQRPSAAVPATICLSASTDNAGAYTAQLGTMTTSYRPCVITQSGGDNQGSVVAMQWSTTLTTSGNAFVTAAPVVQMSSGGNLTISGGLTASTASTLAGATVSGTLTSSSTLSFANASGTALTSTSLYGTLQTPAQANITSLGTLASLFVSGSAGIGTSSVGSGFILDTGSAQYTRLSIICSRVQTVTSQAIAQGNSLLANGYNVVNMLPSALSTYGFQTGAGSYQWMWRAPITGTYFVTIQARFADVSTTQGLALGRYNGSTNLNLMPMGDFVWAANDGSGTNRRQATYSSITTINQGTGLYPGPYTNAVNVTWCEMIVVLLAS